MPRYVILEHDRPVLHWDFLLEAGAVLRAWRLSKRPSPGLAIAATANFDHRLLYLDYEGPVSGNRGMVSRWDFGEFAWQEDGPASVQVCLMGRIIQGRVRLERDAGDDWIFLWEQQKEAITPPPVGPR